MALPLQSRIALVTGGGRGIGRATALALAEAGATVAVLARSVDEVERTVDELRAAGHRAAGASGDVADAAALADALHRLTGQLGNIEVLVNNAGVSWPVGPTATIDPEQFAQAVAVNLVGPLRCIRHVLPGMLEAGWGRIVNVTTGAANPPGMPRAAAYSASKAGLNQLTVNLAAELAGTGVTVTAVDPGPVDTAMQDYMRDQPAEVIGDRVHGMFQRFHAEGRLNHPTQPANLITALAAGEVTGEIVAVGSDLAAELVNTSS
ncbi:short chain dehydrogenase [Modestobacter sp. DSM 44400]|uniref:SDR family NAD(P)-dependent oxidoreductase n=1 Tax=Modestobacter sp. DSM 44400 TaxID=1550230 RepID=UPI0008996B8C|nr:SDR family oxidoreductase [Modestobacter sp. DSM 44400]SDX59973.1 short chain dehydrogenase [Modestobacter sp. DSM 44400]